MLTSEQQCAAASEAAMARDFDQLYEDPPGVTAQPTTMNAAEHTAVIKRAIANGWRVRYRLHGYDHDRLIADVVDELALDEDTLGALLVKAHKLAASSAPAQQIADAFTAYSGSAIENAGCFFAWVEAEHNSVTYGPAVKPGWAFWRQ